MKTIVDKLIADRIENDTATPEEIQEEMCVFVHGWAKEHGVDVKEASVFFLLSSEYTIRLMFANQRKAQGKSSTEPSSTCNC